MKILHQYHSEPQVIDNTTITFEPHLHSEVEIVVLFSGTAEAHVAGKTYTLFPGDAALVFPNMVHSYYAAEPLHVGKFIFSPTTIPELNSTFLTTMPLCPYVSDVPGLSAIAADILSEYHRSSPIVKRAYLSLLTGKLLEHCELEKHTHARRDTVDSILTYCQAHFRSEITLQTLSETLGISKSHLSHIFADKIKMDFRNYLNTLRINHAYTLLADTDLSMSEIAEACGFSGLRTFDRAFLLHNGISPTAYKKQLYRISNGQ